MPLNQIDGLPIFDAKGPIKLSVTKQDVSRADPKHPESCAVAVACRRSTHAKEVRVHLGRVYVRTNNVNWTRYKTPQNMRAEIIAFDRGGKFEPQDFVLPPMQPSHRASGKRQGGATIAKKVSSGKKRKAPHVVKNVRTGPA